MGVLRGLRRAGIRSGYNFVAVVPSDDDDLIGGLTRGIYVGKSGDLAVHDSEGDDIVFPDVAAGMVHPLAVLRVLDTGTDADDIVAIY